MIKIEKAQVTGWEPAIRGMRNSYDSWDKSDSGNKVMNPGNVEFGYAPEIEYIIGSADLTLMKQLCKAGSSHRKFMRMLIVYCDITAPLYWWKEFDTYRMGVEKNSCSTMHRITAKDFTLDDFSCEHLKIPGTDCLKETINLLNAYRTAFSGLDSNNEIARKCCWWQMIQLLPSSYNQKRTCMITYEALANMYHDRKNHRLGEWRDLCKWIETLPHSELITGEEK